MSSDYGLVMTPAEAPSYTKDPSDTIDYSLSWHQLGSDTLVTATWTSDSLTVGTSSISGLVTTCFVSGGTEGEVANLTCTVTTGMGRTLQRTVYIAGQRWKIQRARLRNLYGDCDYEQRLIRIDERVTGTDYLDTLLHELIHARWPDIAEESVAEFAGMLTTVLEQEGYQRGEE